VKKCSGCGEPLSCHKAGQYGKHCQGVDKDPPADKQPIELEDPNPKSAMDVLEQRKAELEKAIAEAELRNEVAALEKRLGALKSSGPTPPSGEAKQTGPKVSTSAEEAATLGAALHLGPGDLTLDHLRMNKELVTRVNENYPDLEFVTPDSKKAPAKGKTKLLSPENFVFNSQSAEAPKYEDLSAEEFLSGSMGLLLSPNLPTWEARGRMALLQFACHRLARYRWPVVRAFHHAAINQALRDPTKWNNDWTELKDYYFDGDPDNLKGNNNTTGKPKTTVRTCYKYNKGECSSTSCRYAHYCSYCLDTTGQKYKHAESTCRRRGEKTTTKKEDSTKD